MRTYTVYPSKDEWLAARDRTPGASTLGRWHAYHELTPPPDNEHVRNALTFGSLWEPYIAKQWALTNGYKTCPPNIIGMISRTARSHGMTIRFSRTTSLAAM